MDNKEKRLVFAERAKGRKVKKTARYISEKGEEIKEEIINGADLPEDYLFYCYDELNIVGDTLYNNLIESKNPVKIIETEFEIL